MIVGSRSHRGDSLDSVLERIGAHEMRPMGSSLKFCLVAEGTADFYPRLGPTCEWDTAAAQAVVEAAGGSVTTLDGLPLRYNERDTLLNPHFLAFGDASRALAQAVLSPAAVELSWSLLLLCIAFSGFVLFWHDALGARERANDAARETCVATGGDPARRDRRLPVDARSCGPPAGGWPSSAPTSSITRSTAIPGSRGSS